MTKLQINPDAYDVRAKTPGKTKSWLAREIVQDAKTSPELAFLCLCIATHQNWSINPKHMRKRYGMNEAIVKRALREAKDRGWLRDRVQGPRRGNGQHGYARDTWCLPEDDGSGGGIPAKRNMLDEVEAGAITWRQAVALMYMRSWKLGHVFQMGQIATRFGWKTPKAGAKLVNPLFGKWIAKASPENGGHGFQINAEIQWLDGRQGVIRPAVKKGATGRNPTHRESTRRESTSRETTHTRFKDSHVSKTLTSQNSSRRKNNARARKSYRSGNAPEQTHVTLPPVPADKPVRGTSMPEDTGRKNGAAIVLDGNAGVLTLYALRDIQRDTCPEKSLREILDFCAEVDSSPHAKSVDALYDDTTLCTSTLKTAAKHWATGNPWRHDQRTLTTGEHFQITEYDADCIRDRNPTYAKWTSEDFKACAQSYNDSLAAYREDDGRHPENERMGRFVGSRMPHHHAKSVLQRKNNAARVKMKGVS